MSVPKFQNGYPAEYLRETFSLPESDIEKALSVSSRKLVYLEFFVLTPAMSQISSIKPQLYFNTVLKLESRSWLAGVLVLRSQGIDPKNPSFQKDRE